MSKPTRLLIPVLSAAFLGACSNEPEWVEVYEQCKQTVQTESEKLEAATAGNGQSQAMAESMGNMAMEMAMNACEMIRTNCEQDEKGPTCRAFVERHNSKQ